MRILPWIYATRPKTLVASIVPVISATLILPDKHIFKLDIFVLTSDLEISFFKNISLFLRKIPALINATYMKKYPFLEELFFYRFTGGV